VLARDSFPAFGEAKGASDLLSRFQKEQRFLAFPAGGEGGIAH